MRQLIKEYFSFTRKERIAVITLLSVIVAVYLLPHFIQAEHSPPLVEEVREKEEFKIAAAAGEKSFQSDDNIVNKAPPVRLFYFDPNTITAAEWGQLGLREKTVKTILNFLSKGGRFYKADDLQKIYGLREDEFARISPYVKINDAASRTARYERGVGGQSFKKKIFSKEPYPQESFGKQAFKNEPYQKESFAKESFRSERYQKEPFQKESFKKEFKSRVSVVDINTGDIDAFVALPGIGNTLAGRIINFRERLGGFYAMSQVGETYGLQDSTFQKILPFLKMETAAVKKINVNTADIETLKAHPYIRWQVANAIIKYREQHGTFKRLEEMQQIGAVTEDIYKKMVPYLKLDE